MTYYEFVMEVRKLGPAWDLYYLTFIIGRIAYRTKNDYNHIVLKLGDYYLDYLMKSYDEIHCINPEIIVDELIEMCDIKRGNKSFLTKGDYIVNYDGVSSDYYSLIRWLWLEDYNSYKTNNKFNDLVREVYASEVSKAIMDFTSFIYWQSPEFHHMMFFGEEINYDVLT